MLDDELQEELEALERSRELKRAHRERKLQVMREADARMTEVDNEEAGVIPDGSVKRALPPAVAQREVQQPPRKKREPTPEPRIVPGDAVGSSGNDGAVVPVDAAASAGNSGGQCRAGVPVDAVGSSGNIDQTFPIPIESDAHRASTQLAPAVGGATAPAPALPDSGRPVFPDMVTQPVQSSAHRKGDVVMRQWGRREEPESEAAPAMSGNSPPITTGTAQGVATARPLVASDPSHFSPGGSMKGLTPPAHEHMREHPSLVSGTQGSVAPAVGGATAPSIAIQGARVEDAVGFSSRAPPAPSSTPQDARGGAAEGASSRAGHAAPYGPVKGSRRSSSRASRGQQLAPVSSGDGRSVVERLAELELRQGLQQLIDEEDRREKDALTAERQELLTRYGASMRELTETQSRNAQLQDQLAEAQRKEAEVSGANASLSSRADAARACVEALQQQVATAQHQIDAIKSAGAAAHQLAINDAR